MTKRLSVTQVKATFSERIREVESGEAILITRHGAPIAALIRAEEADLLHWCRAPRSEEGLASLAGGWEDSDDLARLLTDNRSSR